MGQWINLTAADGHEFRGYRAAPTGRTVGSLVVLQEIFGVNAHIRRVCDDLAPRGYTVVAPALFDRAERGCELGYDRAAAEKGLEVRGRIPLETTLTDIQATIDHLTPLGRVAVLGYCWGGSLAYLAAARLDGLDAAVCYYGGMIAEHAEEKPKVPTMLHFGDHDPMIPPGAVEAIRAARPEVAVHVYQANHGFNCDDRYTYNAGAARAALERSLHFLADHLVQVTT